MEGLLFTLLPPAQPRWKSFVMAWSVQALPLVGLLLVSARFHQGRIPFGRDRVTNLVSYEPLVLRERQLVNPPLLAGSKPLIEERDRPLEPLVVTPRVMAPEHKVPEPEPTAPELSLESKMLVIPSAPTSKIVAVGTFSAGSSAIGTVAKPAAAVQASGFGDINGIHASEHHEMANISEKGLFDLTTGSGHGSGIGGTNPGVVMKSGFSNGLGTGAVKSVGTTKQSGFDARYSETESHQPSSGANAPVEITFKPKPDYTDEGRKLGINGEVRLQVMFSADGRVHVIRVLQGLGYGLDEQAVKAAEQIKFKPALHAGQPIDSMALVQIIFELIS